MRVLVLNCGSSSLKYQLIETSAEQIAKAADRVLAHGSIDRIASDEEYKRAIQDAFDRLKQAGVLAHPDEIEGVGHRVVHGGERFTQSVIIDEKVAEEIDKLSELAPLHNPNNLKGYYAAKELLPKAAQVAVFDTAFHATLPPHAFLYAVPYEFYQRDKLRRYGFHGTSHRYLSYRFAQITETPRDRNNLITIHLGNGCSACAIQGGKSIDTSMGFTPMDGLVMGTRPGDLDPGAVLYLAERDPNGDKGVNELLNKHAGLAGFTGKTGDMRDLLDSRDKGDERATQAIDLFCYRIVKYIASYWCVLQSTTALIFAGGIGENSAPIRAQVCEGLGALGVRLDGNRNDQVRAQEQRISAADSKIPVWVIPTDEELVIAQDTFRCIAGLPFP